jgi:hypothetical protein
MSDTMADPNGLGTGYDSLTGKFKERLARLMLGPPETKNDLSKGEVHANQVVDAVVDAEDPLMWESVGARIVY